MVPGWLGPGLTTGDASFHSGRTQRSADEVSGPVEPWGPEIMILTGGLSSMGFSQDLQDGKIRH